MSCTKEKTNYLEETSREIPEVFDFQEASSMLVDRYRISIEALNGTFYTGYNELRVRITDTQTGETINPDSIQFIPISKIADGVVTSCPHLFQLQKSTQNAYWEGYSIFIDEQLPNPTWKLYVNLVVGQQNYTATSDITTKEQLNKNLNKTLFRGNDSLDYMIALVSPRNPQVGTNPIIAGIFKRITTTHLAEFVPLSPSYYQYVAVNDHTLELDPRMPEPSMGNHSSPNNVNLSQRNDGFYEGVVNYTMTGNWTLNFILKDARNTIVKGNAVSTAFTPGVQGVKGELHIDILF
ncbi:hypothetical protein [Sphingobacterium corticibacter]|uniref:YtkA-like domain-containing protein n=1 Tax=Sphingobacterium corticibacter TaxID=2171749 RepID=A0A2T8HMP4_9SPHI|nr:hypothetical protein [Sphingobacterium corticibacter]PVH26707.1 hypothetical protein DC487_03605 [Sphingobacterium corticibacter]